MNAVRCLVPAAALAVATAAAGTISVNFGADRTEAPGGSLASATESAGAIVVSSPNWNNASGASGTLNALKDGTGAVTGASVVWTSPNTYRSSSTDVAGNDNGILTKGYLDDGGAGYAATISGGYFLSNVYLVLATDSNADPNTNVTLGGYRVNGITYGWNGTATATGVATWGTANSWSNAATLVEGKNYLKVSGVAGAVVVTGVRPSGGRSALAGVQVENAYTGTMLHWDIDGATAGAGGATPSGTWDGATSNWSTDATGSSGTSTWGADNVAVFSAGNDATGSYTVTVDGTQGARGLWLQEGSVTFTGGTINLTNERAIVIDSGAHTLSSALTADGTVQVSTAASSSLTLNNGSFAGTYAVNGLGSVNLGGNYALGGLVGTGAVNLGANTLTINGAGNTTYSGVLSGTGGLAKQGAGTFTLNNTNNSFSGNVDVSGGTLDTGTSQGGGTNGYLGAVNGARTVTISNGASVVLRANNVFGGGGKTAATIPAMVVDGATLNTARFNIVGNLTLNGASLVNAIPTGTDSASYDGFQFLGSVTVTGSTPSTIGTTTARGNHLLGGGTTTFNVADVTGDAAVDLTVTTNLRDGSGDYSGAAALAKDGAGTMLLTAANSYSGATTITAGTLEIGGTGSLANGSYAGDIANSGALVISSTAHQTLGGVLTGTGPLTKTAASTGRLTLSGTSPGYTGTITVNAGSIGGTGSVAGPLVVDGGSVAIAGGATLTGLTTNGVTFVGSTAVVLESAVVTGNVYDVLTYGAGGATNPANLWVPARGTLADTGTKFTFTAGAVATRTWNTTDGTWDNYQTANFAEDDQKFSAGDTVVFNDPAAPSTVTLVGTLAPASVTVTNANGYIFSGSGIISGAATLAKAGSGTLTINTANTYSGGTTISAGTVTPGNAAALGTGAVALNGGTLNLNGLTISNAITAGGGALGGTGTASGAITGSGAVVIDSDGVITFNNRKEYSGGTTINAGVLDLTGGGGSGGTIRGTVTVTSGGTLRLSTGDATGYGTGTDRLATINISGGTMAVNSTSNQTLGNATINLTGGSITGIAGSNLDFFQGLSTLNSLASDTTSVISGVTLSPLRQGSTTFTVENGGAAVDLQIDSVIRPSGDPGGAVLTKAGAGWLQLNGVNTFDRGMAITGGTLEIGGAGQLGSGNFGRAITNDATFLYSSTANQTLSGAIGGTGSLIKEEASTLTLSGPNNYSGPTTVNAGTLALGNGSALGATTTGTTIASGATLDVGGQAIASGETITVSGTGAAGSAIVGGGTIQGDLLLAGDATIGSSNRLDLGTSGTPRTIQGAYTLTKTGTGSIWYRGPTNGTGNSLAALVIDGGTFGIEANDNALGGVPVTVNPGAVLSSWGSGTAPTSHNNPITLSGGSLGSDLNGQTYTGEVTLTTDSQLGATGSAGNFTLTGAINGSAGLTKTTGSTVTLSGTSTNYTGHTTVAGGTLLVDGSIEHSAVTVDSGAKLGGVGTVGATTVYGTLAPGDSPGTLSATGTVTLDAASTLDWDLDGGDNTTGSGVNDLLAINGNLVLDGTINVTAADADPFATWQGYWTIITYSGTLTDNGLELGTMPTLPAEWWGWAVDTTTQPGEVRLVIPEPSAALLAALGLLGLLRRRRA